jgi:hypothetical protein
VTLRGGITDSGAADSESVPANAGSIPQIDNAAMQAAPYSLRGWVS